MHAKSEERPWRPNVRRPDNFVCREVSLGRNSTINASLCMKATSSYQVFPAALVRVLKVSSARGGVRKEEKPPGRRLCKQEGGNLPLCQSLEAFTAPHTSSPPGATLTSILIPAQSSSAWRSSRREGWTWARLADPYPLRLLVTNYVISFRSCLLLLHKSISPPLFFC